VEAIAPLVARHAGPAAFNSAGVDAVVANGVTTIVESLGLTIQAVIALIKPIFATV
jgi:hypothetical protein